MPDHAKTKPKTKVKLKIKAKAKASQALRPTVSKPKRKKAQARTTLASPRGFQARWTSLVERLRVQPELFWLGVVVLCGLLLRLTHPDWYWNRQFHPDERWIFGVVSQLSYPDAPTALQYGTFPLYLMATIKDIAVWLVSWFGRLDANQFVIGAGRTLSAVFDTGTLIFTYLLGARMFPSARGRRLGLLATTFLAFTVLNIQMAHFFVVDVPLGLLVTAVLYASVGIVQTGRRSDYVLAGVCLGLAMATKTSALPVSLAVGVAHVIGWGQADEADRPRRWLDLGWAVAASGVAFFITMPHALLDWSRFWTNQNEQRRILVTGEADVPYNRQYLHTTAFLYFGKNLIRYTQGWPLGLLSLAAFVGYPLRGLWVLLKGAAARSGQAAWDGIQKNAPLIIVLTFGVAYALVIGTSFAKFNRYCLPLTPVLALAAAHALFDLWERAQKIWLKRLLIWVGALTVGITLLWALAFVAIYQAEHPWVAASRWLLQHAADYSTGPGGFLRPTAVLNEEWGDDLPVYVEGVPGKAYRINKFSVQEPDTPNKRAAILAMLPGNDWIAVADTRAHAVYRRLPERYPINAAYYELLFGNRLGYHLAAEFKNYPRLFGLEFPDDRADESFTLYDHPHVYLFQRDAVPLSAEEAARRLDEGILRVQQRLPAALAPVALPRVPATAPAAPVPTALPTVVNKNIGQTQARPAFILGHLNSFTAGLAWLLLMEVIGLLALPVCLHVFPRLPDAGAALAKIVGSLIFAWTVWMLVSLGVLRHTQGASAVILLGFAVAAVAWVLRHPGTVEAFVRQQARNWAWSEAVFIIAFVGYMLTKLYNPDIHNPFGQGYNGGGEPMGMTFFTGVYKSLHFPPYDAWLSGYPINYYYYGHVILGILAKLIGVPPAWSYNITLSLLFALTVTGLYGLGHALTGKRSYGLVAAVAGAMLGNLHALFYLLEPLNRGTLFNNGLAGLTAWVQETWRHAGRFEFMWNPTRLIKGTINEMPWFSFLYGDLHAHIIAIPYSLPLIGWGLNVLSQAPRDRDRFPEAGGDTPWERGWSAFLAALTLGALSAINTWNFPPYALLVLMILTARAYRNQTKPGWAWKPLGTAALAWLRVVVGGLLLLFFFHRNFIPNSTSLAFVNPEVRTTLKDFMVFFALAIFAISSFWAQEIYPSLAAWLQKLGGKPRARAAGWEPWVRGAQTLWHRYPALVYVAGTLALCVTVLLIFGQVLLTVLTIMLLLGLYVVVVRPLDAPALLALLLAELGFAVVWGCEWVHVKDFMGVGGDMSRMNTVFKFYMVVWIFFALALTAGLHRVLAPATVPETRTRAKTKAVQAKKTAKKIPVSGGFLRSAHGRRNLWLGAAGMVVLWAWANFFQVNTEWPWLTLLLFAGLLVVPWLQAARPQMFRGVWTWVLAAVLFGVGLYPPISLYNRLRLCSEFKNPTLNGEAYLDRMNPGDARALSWINENITATDVVLEAPGRQGYNCFDTRVAIFTGQPTLIGWIGEEEQMRYNDALTSARVSDANWIFGSPDAGQAQALMQRYRVKYVYVGANEKKTYPLIYLEKFRKFMDVVYDFDGVTIYQTRL